MAYFPFFMDIEKKKALIVGGGNVAQRKVEKLLPFGCSITIISPALSDELQALENIEIIKRNYIIGDEIAYDFVIAATDDVSTNETISKECRRHNIPVNVVDNPELCTFLFPSLVKNGKLTVGICTSGSSPTAAMEIRKELEESIPKSFDEILDYLYETRKTIRDTYATEAERHRILKKLYRECMQKGRALTPDETYVSLHDKAGKGYVYIVGAGCGNKDLLTLRAYDAIRKSDVIVYDDLIDNDILDINKDATHIYMGKRSGLHSYNQEEINRKLVELSKDGLIITRLKGGDPFVFGRGGEEALALIDSNIPFEVVPGITSSIAIPELSGIPVTHRGISRGFMVVTGRTRDDDEFDAILDSISSFPGTAVILMGLGKIEEITEGLLKRMMNPETPAAVLSGGNSEHPAEVRGTLLDIAVLTREKEVLTPAVIVIGETAGMDLRYMDDVVTDIP